MAMILAFPTTLDNKLNLYSLGKLSFSEFTLEELGQIYFERFGNIDYDLSDSTEFM